MCDELATAENLRAATPHPVPGSAVDPVTLKPVDEVVVTTLVENIYDALLGGDETITRAPLAAGIAQAPQFESGTTQVGLMAEHGLSALVSVRRRRLRSQVALPADATARLAASTRWDAARFIFLRSAVDSAWWV